MKKQLNLNVLSPSFLNKRMLQRGNFILYALSIFLVVTFCISCETINSDSTTDSSVMAAENTSKKVHLAFAGGGWRAHTGHSGWTLSLLNPDNSHITLDSAFTNVGTISSNSGGSWFSTMLMYSPAFVDSIQAPNAIETWSSVEGGWTGGQYDLFNTFDCKSTHGGLYMPCVLLAEYPLTAQYWLDIVTDVVFKDFPMDQSITLADEVQSWAKDKPLLLAATMLKDEVVLNDTFVSIIHQSKNKNRFYQACLDPGTPNLKGFTGASCTGIDSTEVTPVTFSRKLNKSHFLTPPFFSQNNGTAKFTVGYKKNGTKKSGVDTLSHVTIQGPLSTSSVPVIVAAATSSAATGFLAMEANSGIHAEHFDREAISYKMTNKKVEHVQQLIGTELNQLQREKVVSFADGGPVDNSGVAQLVSSLQFNSPSQDTFHVVAFDNVTSAFPVVSKTNDTLEVGTDIAYLFGKGLEPGNKFCAYKKLGCLTVPDLQIFDQAALTNTPMTWTYPGRNGEKLIYTKYTASTHDNSVFNIKSGTIVVLHAFTCVYPLAGTVPQNQKGTTKLGFSVYGDMIKFINDGMEQGGGLINLQKAVGIK